MIETMLTPSTETGLKKFFDYFVNLKHDFVLVADMDHFTIWRNDIGENSIFLIKDSEESVAYFQVSFSDQYAEMKHGYVDARYRKQGIGKKFCWFINTREGFSLMFDQHLSQDVELVKSLHSAGTFKIYWLLNDKKIAFDPDLDPADDEYLSFEKPTGWRLIVENSQRLPHFRTWTMVNGASFLSETYCYFD